VTTKAKANNFLVNINFINRTVLIPVKSSRTHAAFRTVNKVYWIMVIVNHQKWQYYLLSLV
jgi:hypothetical protein